MFCLRCSRGGAALLLITAMQKKSPAAKREFQPPPSPSLLNNFKYPARFRFDEIKLKFSIIGVLKEWNEFRITRERHEKTDFIIHSWRECRWLICVDWIDSNWNWFNTAYEFQIIIKRRMGNRINCTLYNLSVFFFFFFLMRFRSWWKI